VRCSEPDAIVEVGGAGALAAQETAARPLVVPIGQSREDREVFVYKKGFVAYRRRHGFTAGETLRLDGVLEPDAVDGSSPP
jgi:hypothetical protein